MRPGWQVAQFADQYRGTRHVINHQFCFARLLQPENGLDRPFGRIGIGKNRLVAQKADSRYGRGRFTGMDLERSDASPYTQASARLKYLHAMLISVRHVNTAACIPGNTKRITEFPIARTTAAKLAQVAAIAVKFLHALVVVIRHENIAARTYPDAMGIAELAVA